MNYLIVMPRFVDKVGEWYQIPLGMLYIAASLKQAGFKLNVLNLNNECGAVEDILSRAILENKIEVVFTGGLSTQCNALKEILATAKRLNPNIITIVGGGIITATPVPAMRALELVDYGIIGEGEITSCELCQTLETSGDVSSVAGLIYPPPPPAKLGQKSRRAEIYSNSSS